MSAERELVPRVPELNIFPEAGVGFGFGADGRFSTESETEPAPGYLHEARIGVGKGYFSGPEPDSKKESSPTFRVPYPRIRTCTQLIA